MATALLVEQAQHRRHRCRIGLDHPLSPRRVGVPSRRRADTQPPRRDPITEMIACRAYELFLERGAQHGHDLDDWLQAERELLDAARAGHSLAIEPNDESARPLLDRHGIRRE